MTLTRRGILSGLGAVLAAPAIVNAESLMRLRGDFATAWNSDRGFVEGVGLIYPIIQIRPEWLVIA